MSTKPNAASVCVAMIATAIASAKLRIMRVSRSTHQPRSPLNEQKPLSSPTAPNTRPIARPA